MNDDLESGVVYVGMLVIFLLVAGVIVALLGVVAVIAGLCFGVGALYRYWERRTLVQREFARIEREALSAAGDIHDIARETERQMRELVDASVIDGTATEIERR
ncbi:MAG: hypothetical protein ABSG64_07695 [Solirubrobacteraceae bacterium]|jgi:hypothetical protein